MHELGVVAEEARRLERETAGARVSTVTLQLGPGADRAVVESPWAHVTHGTALEAAMVSWVEASHLLQCFSCGSAYHGDKLARCPSCRGDGLVIEQTPDFAVRGWTAEGAP